MVLLQNGIKFKEEKQREEKEYQERNKKKLAFIKDINENGGYYRGTFGRDQYYYYRVFNLKMVGGEIIMDVEKIVMFSGDADKGDKFSIERRIKEYQREDRYYLTNEMRVTEKDWNELTKYLDNTIDKFFDRIDLSKFA